jgi:hypothetical protein
MRFVPRWVATVPSIDLRATFRAAIAWSSAPSDAHPSKRRVAWGYHARRRRDADGPRVCLGQAATLHDLEDGQIRFATQLMPRSATPLAGGSSRACRPA